MRAYASSSSSSSSSARNVGSAARRVGREGLDDATMRATAFAEGQHDGATHKADRILHNAKYLVIVANVIEGRGSGLHA